MLIDALRRSGPAIAVINKIDLVKDPAELEARKAELEGLGVFDQVCTVSVRDNRNCEELFEIWAATQWKAPITSTTTPTPICRRRSWWPN